VDVDVAAADVAAATEVLASRLKVLGEPTRLEIVRRLAVEDLCTCHLVADLGITQPLVSHHLRALRRAGLVRTEPAGPFTYYGLDADALGDLAEAIGDVVQRHDRGGQRRRPCA
jgi:ArsR family transcriptional regulator